MISKQDADGVLYARTRQGYELPIIDVTHPRFAVPTDPSARRALEEAFIRDDRSRRFIPGFLLRLMLRAAARKSRLVAALVDPDAAYLDGISTYVMKLGADNLVPPFDGPMDRRLAASPHITLLRLRMQQVATLLADGIAGDPAFTNDAPLRLINIGGGPALDSINSLLLLNRSRPDLLRRSITIHVLDSSPDGAFFGANALSALKAEGGPLEGIDVALERRAYDWNEPAPLERLMQDVVAAGAVAAASSEGGLFEYGSDRAILENLRALRADGNGVRLVSGSVTRADETRRRMIAVSGLKLIPRGLAGFAPLAEAAGFSIVKTETVLLSDQVLLRP